MNLTLEKLKEARDAGIPDDVIWETAASAEPKFKELKQNNIPLDVAFEAYQQFKPQGTSFTKEVGQLGSAFMESIGRPLENMGESFDVLGYKGVAEALKGAITEPENYESAAARFTEPNPEDTQFLGFAWQYAPRAIVEQTGQAIGSIATRAGGAALGAAAGSVAGPKGVAAGGLAGAFVGPAIFEAAQIIGPVAKERAMRNGREIPTNEDILGATLTAIGSGALNAVGAKYLPGGEKATGKFFKRLASSFAGEGLTETGQAFVEQTGSSLATEEGLEINVKQAIGEGIIGGGTAAGITTITSPFVKSSDDQVIRTPEQAEEIDIDAKASEEAVKLMANPADQATDQSISRAKEIESFIANNEVLAQSLEPNDPEAKRLNLETKEAKTELNRIKNQIEESVGLTPLDSEQEISSRIENTKIQMSGLDPTSRKFKELESQLSNDEASLAALSEPIAEVERQQAELAQAIAAEPEAVTPTAQETAQVTPPVEEAAPVSETITPVVSEEVAQVSEVTPAPTISEIPQTSEMIGAEPTQPATAEVVAAPSITKVVPQEVFDAFSENQPIMERIRKDALEKRGGSLQTYITTSIRTKGAPKSQIQSLTNKVLKQFEESASLAEVEEAVTNELEKISSIKEKKKSDDAKLQSAIQRTGETYELDTAIQDYKNKLIELDRAQKSMLSTPALRQIERVGAKNNLEKSKQNLISIAERVTPAPETAAPTPEATTGIAVGNRIKLGKSPQTYTIEEVIPQSETEKELGEQYYSVKNEKTGETQVVEKNDMKPVKRLRRGEAGGVLIPSREDFEDLGRRIYEKGMQFKTWANRMVAEFGDAVRQFLGDIWKTVSGIPAKINELAGYLPGKGEGGGVLVQNELSDSDKRFANLETKAKAGDKEAEAEAQRMVDEAAKNEGLEKVWRASQQKENFVRGKATFFTRDREFAQSMFSDALSRPETGYELRQYFLKIDKPVDDGSFGLVSDEESAKYSEKGETLVRDDATGAGGEIVVFNPDQIKPANPFTYDDAGNLIPLSLRFKPTTPKDKEIRKQVSEARKIEQVTSDAVSALGADVKSDFDSFINEGKTIEQIANQKNKSVNDVRVNIVKSRNAVKKALAKAKLKPLDAKPANPVVEWTTKSARKYLTKEGPLPGGTYQKWVRRNARISKETEQVKQSIEKLYSALRQIYKINKIEFILNGLSSVPPDMVEKLNEALAGKIDINTMPKELRKPITKMRQHIDALSTELIATGQLPDFLEAKTFNNLGTYLTRSYKIFSDPKWIQKIPAEKMTNARNFLYQQGAKNDPNFTLEDADRQLMQMLNDWAGEAESKDKRRGGKLGAKDLSVMMQRSDIPKELRDVMGENNNAIFNYANTVGKISRFIADQNFLDAVKQEGAGKFLYTKDAAPAGFNTLIAAEDSRTMSPLNGLRTTPEIAEAFAEFGKSYDATQNPALYALGWLNAVGKANLTVGSVLTQMRNVIGQPFFFLANGHTNLGVINAEVNRLMKDMGLTKEEARQELVKMAAGEALINENAYAGELKEAFEQVGLKTFDDMDADAFSRQFVLLRLFKSGTRGAQNIYQKTDEFGKMIGWLNETDRVMRMNKGMSREEAMSIASERIRNTYPTYTQGSQALRLFRRQPFIGPFATFFYETFRTTYWNLKYAFDDINKGGAARKEGIARLAGSMAQISIGAFAANAVSKMIAGIGDDEEEDVRRMLPPWEKDAAMIWFPKDKQGVYNYINLSYVSPYNALTDPFVAMMSGFARGEDPVSVFVEAAGSFLEPFVSEQPVTAAIMDVSRNKTETGRKVYNEEADLSTKTTDILLHVFGQAFTPGTVDRIRKRIVPAIYGETVGTRAPEPVKEIASELTGIRFQNLDMKQAFQNRAWEFSKSQNESERIFRDVATRRRRVTAEEQIKAYRTAEQSRFDNWQEMYRDYMAVRRAGATEDEAIELMTDIRISKREAYMIADGEYMPYQISKEVIRRSELNGNEVPLDEIDAIADSMPTTLQDLPKKP